MAGRLAREASAHAFKMRASSFIPLDYERKKAAAACVEGLKGIKIGNAMKNLLKVLIAAAVSISALSAETRPAPEFVIKMTDGTQKLLSSYKGKTVCLAFF